MNSVWSSSFSLCISLLQLILYIAGLKFIQKWTFCNHLFILKSIQICVTFFFSTQYKIFCRMLSPRRKLFWKQSRFKSRFFFSLKPLYYCYLSCCQMNFWLHVTDINHVSCRNCWVYLKNVYNFTETKSESLFFQSFTWTYSMMFVKFYDVYFNI